jgi:hypothetical protein
MKNRNDFMEKRKHNRFKVKEGAFAMIMSAPAELDKIQDMSIGEIAFGVLKAKPIRMGQIVNISKGGLAFRYIDDKEESNESFELDILFASDAFYLKNVPFRTVSDFDTVSKFPIHTFKMRQQGVQFGEMDSNQTSQLDYFIQNYKISKV